MKKRAGKSKIEEPSRTISVLKEPIPVDKESLAYLFWDWRIMELAYDCPADNEQIYKDIHKKQNAVRDKMLLITPQSAAELAIQILAATSYGDFAPPKRLIDIAEILTRP